MSIEGNSIASLLRDCESRLIESRRSVEDAIDLVRRASDLLMERPVRSASDIPLEAGLAPRSEELVHLVLSALDKSGAHEARDDYMSSLVYRDDENRYRIGRRQVALTDSEKHILDILWQAMPNPVSRSDLHQALYAGNEKATLGTIDVFVSNLRQKLKLAGGGRDFIQSTRGQGWSLKPEFCRNRPKLPTTPDGNRQSA